MDQEEDNVIAEDKLLDYSKEKFQMETKKVREQDKYAEHHMAYIKISL